MIAVLPRELHTSERPSATAQWTTLGRAVELDRPVIDRIVDDPYAPVFLDRRARTVAAMLRLGGAARRPVERSEFAAVSTSALCRHRFIDEHLLASLSTVAQVVILGAGYDSRAWRFASELSGRPVFEVDLAPLSRRKAAIIAGRPDLFGHAAIDRVEIDFRTQSLSTRLLESGFTAGAPSFVAWEGVSMYLDRAAVDATLGALASLCGAGSTLAMDFWQRVPVRRVYDGVRRLGERAIRLIGEPMTGPVAIDSAPGLLEAHGFSVADAAGASGLADAVDAADLADAVGASGLADAADTADLADADAMTVRYATDGRRCDPAMYVVAARRT